MPTPSAVICTMRARHTCFCGLLRSATIAAKRTRSPSLTSTVIPWRILTPHHPAEHTPCGLFCQILSTRVAQRPVVPMNPGNAGGGKGPQFKTDATCGLAPNSIT